MMKMKSLVSALGVVTMLVAGCTPAQYASQADQAAYTALASGQNVALGERHPFSIEYEPVRSEPDGPITIDGKVIPIASKDEPVALTLEECLAIAVRSSRSYQDRKEQLYSAALALANARREWENSLFEGPITANASHTAVNRGSETNAADASAGLAWTRSFIHGGQLALGLSLDFLADFTGGGATTVGSLLEANFTQPLLRGAWRGFAYEDQYRLERDFLISVFSYQRFTQTFATDIVSEHYSVLEQRDQLANELANIERLRETLALTRTLVQGGQVSRIQQDQAEQDLLNAQVRYERAQQAYQDTLDSFKLTLGLPVRARMELEYPGALEALRRVGPPPIPFDEATATDVALAVRPDVLTERANVRDAHKDVELAADEFNPRLDLALAASVPSKEKRQFWELQPHRNTRDVSVAFEYDIDQTDNRDAYRNALIAAAKAVRDYDEFVDQVRLQVRRSYRSLMQSRRSYELQMTNVEIARRRRALAALQQREGEASARDVLEAEEALRNAQNGLTSALVQYVTTRLNFLADLGMIEVGQRGQIHEREEPFRFLRLQQRYE